MRLVFGLVLLIGVALAGAAVYMAKDFFAQQQAQLAEAEAAKQAIVPTVGVMVVNNLIRYMWGNQKVYLLQRFLQLHVSCTDHQNWVKMIVSNILDYVMKIMIVVKIWYVDIIRSFQRNVHVLQ